MWVVPHLLFLFCFLINFSIHCVMYSALAIYRPVRMKTKVVGISRMVAIYGTGRYISRKKNIRTKFREVKWAFFVEVFSIIPGMGFLAFKMKLKSSSGTETVISSIAWYLLFIIFKRQDLLIGLAGTRVRWYALKLITDLPQYIHNTTLSSSRLRSHDFLN